MKGSKSTCKFSRTSGGIQSQFGSSVVLGRSGKPGSSQGQLGTTEGQLEIIQGQLGSPIFSSSGSHSVVFPFESPHHQVFSLSQLSQLRILHL